MHCLQETLAPNLFTFFFLFQLINSPHPLGSNSLGMTFEGGAFDFVIRESVASSAAMDRQMLRNGQLGRVRKSCAAVGLVYNIVKGS